MARRERETVRWDRLFDDLEAQLRLDEVRARGAETADRTRHERSQLDLQARLLANVGNGAVGLRLPTGTVAGRLDDVGPDWLLMEHDNRATIVSLAAVRSVTGLQRGARTPSVVARRFALGAALRVVSRDRAVVELVDIEGRALTGTIDVLGADHLELAQHPSDASRREPNIVGRLLVPLWALAWVRRL